ncbi:MAG: M23 family metallopeptidase [Chitinophagaceae bacterium]|nr:MAG: M23 family metallopeptidase [Chitinophagaceae bacterium]
MRYDMNSLKRIAFVCFALSLFLCACKSGPFNLIKPASPHEAYQRKLVSAGLDQTYMGETWITKAHQSFGKAVAIDLPYQERGYFAAEKIDAAVLSFNLQRGQKLTVKVERKLADRFKLYVDLLQQTENNVPKLLGSIDTLGNPLEIAIDKSGIYLIRLQPELLSSGEYTLSLTTGPSLKFPLKDAKANQIRSVFGDGRDGNTRKHEGIDIFAPFRTPVIAVSSGRVTAVNENNLGGKVVWFRPDGKDYTLYYAHLDEQIVSGGQLVKYGDTLGRMGNTGNAKTTAPHLHFGIYTNNGAVDPFPFVNPTVKSPPPILAPTNVLNASMRTVSTAAVQNLIPNTVANNVILRVLAASENKYRVELPDGRVGMVNSKQLTSTAKPLKKISVGKQQLDVFDQPDSLAAVKLQLKLGENATVLGNFENFQFIETGQKITGWIRK